MRSPRPFLSLSVAAAGVLALLLSFAGQAPGMDSGRRAIRVMRVVDGDTIVVREGPRRLRVRLLGVDTPELGHGQRRAERLADEAARFTGQALRRAWRVELEVAGDRVDDYGRTLGFLWIQPQPPARAFNLSEELLRQGLARAFHGYRYPNRPRFLALEAEARRAGRGLWKR